MSDDVFSGNACLSTLLTHLQMSVISSSDVLLPFAIMQISLDRLMPKQLLLSVFSFIVKVSGLLERSRPQYIVDDKILIHQVLQILISHSQCSISTMVKVSPGDNIVGLDPYLTGFNVRIDGKVLVTVCSKLFAFNNKMGTNNNHIFVVCETASCCRCCLSLT